MTRPNSLDFSRPKTPNSPSTESTTTPTASRSPASPTSPSKVSPPNPANRAWLEEKQKRVFLHHLKQWSNSHDTSAHFHGKISLVPHHRGEELALGKSISCTLTATNFVHLSKNIVVRLFAPQEGLMYDRHAGKRLAKLGPVNLVGTKSNVNDEKDTPSVCKNGQSSRRRYSTVGDGCYRLVVRCGAGWMTAREYFSNFYFKQLESRKPRSGSIPHIYAIDDIPMHRSQLLGPLPSTKDMVTIRPLFHPFRRLPSELQEMILITAAGLSKTYNLCYDTHLFSGRKTDPVNPISLSTMFQISKSLSGPLIPFVFRSTDFHFGLTGFTNFLWQSGPGNRPEIRRITFHFGKLALLHCIRWLAPDPVFELLEPPVVTDPRSLQYFWRCQIQDLAREINLLTLTLDIRGLPTADVAMVVRILRDAFGSIERVRFVETDKQGNSKVVGLEDPRLSGLKEQQSWRVMCASYFERHKRHQYFSKWELMNLGGEHLDVLMDLDKEAFDQ